MYCFRFKILDPGPVLSAIYQTVRCHSKFKGIRNIHALWPNFIYWQVRSPLIEIPSQYPAYTPLYPARYKKYPADPASTPPVWIKTIPRHSGDVNRAGTFFVFHTVWNLHISTIFILVDSDYSVLLFWQNGWIASSEMEKMFHIFYRLSWLET